MKTSICHSAWTDCSLSAFAPTPTNSSDVATQPLDTVGSGVLPPIVMNEQMCCSVPSMLRATATDKNTAQGAAADEDEN